MGKSLKILSAALIALSLAACSSPEKMAKRVENVKITSNPEVLEVVAGKVFAKLSLSYPKGYFHPKAILEVTPVVVYEGGEIVLPVLKYQGEKVLDNFKSVPADGGTVNEKISFNYVKGMEKSYLELRSVVKYGDKKVSLPAKKVADGCNTTYMLVNGTDDKPIAVKYKPDNYQSVLKMTEEGQILYNINSSDVRNSELRSKSVRDFQAALENIKKDGRKTLVGTEVVAYASPDGGEKLNDKLSSNRSKSAEKAWEKVLKGSEVASPAVKSVGQDWEGFQELVAASNIEDKDLILRVLSMYSDPAVRENEIRNISEVYGELKSNVLPELRRARFIANIEYKNYTEEELLRLVDENINDLDEPALLRAAKLVQGSKKISIYNKAIKKYRSDVAQYNLAVAYFEQGLDKEAADALAKVKADDSFVRDAKAALALRRGDVAGAEKILADSDNNDSKAVVAILSGRYAEAEDLLAGSKEKCLKGLAYILNGKLDEASKVITCKCPKSSYLKAIIAARKGNTAEVKSNLERAFKNAELKARAAKDIEFASYNK